MVNKPAGLAVNDLQELPNFAKHHGGLIASVPIWDSDGCSVVEQRDLNSIAVARSIELYVPQTEPCLLDRSLLGLGNALEVELEDLKLRIVGDERIGDPALQGLLLGGRRR
ncbi:MAG: hypothetical protein HY288_03385 [Planctomycetia bacterium]|nr:hypothetical protein [Planctomycetia bacterium]